jgi:hypothetical protein
VRLSKCVDLLIIYILDIVEHFDIIFFTETHLDNSISDADIRFPGFEVPIRRDRNCSGGLNTMT